MAAEFSMSGSPQPISDQLSGRLLKGHPHCRAPLSAGEFSHWFESEVALQVSDVNFMVTIPMSKLQGWTAKEREYMLYLYGKLTGENDIIIVRCNKLPRVFIAPRHFFNSTTNYVEVAGDLPIIVDEDSTISDTENNVGAPVDQISAAVVAEAHHLGSEAAAGSSIVDTSDDDDDTPVPAATSRRVGRNGVPRPPNCFILFRTHLHPLVVRDNPGIHNNEISAIISKMWHAAPALIIEQYRDLADQAKAAHKLLHPTYNYRPRKSSEKKRRMTKKKAAALEAFTAQAGQQLVQSGGTIDAVLPTSPATRGDIVNHNVSADNTSNEPQGSGLGFEMVDDTAAVQDEDFRAASVAFVPHGDFEVHISGDAPALAYVDKSIADANHDIDFADFTSQEAFAEVFEKLNGDCGTPRRLDMFPTFANQLYDFDSQTYDHDLHGLFYGDN
ncbi:HMG box protein [Rhexocercosporidium sp. MPI-PUGE-AT-0058]|nr:HMG box protein [Rhexocercosporidium sp. MPI-PUGE-AT-0058]